MSASSISRGRINIVEIVSKEIAGRIIFLKRISSKHQDGNLYENCRIDMWKDICIGCLLSFKR